MRYEEHDTDEIYEVGEWFLARCLKDDGSLLFDGEAIWAKDNIDRLYHVFVEEPDVSDLSFGEKLKQQLQDVAPETQKLMGEILTAHFLFPSNIRGGTKLGHINTALNLCESPLNSDNNPTVVTALNNGIGSGGQGYNSGRFRELEFFLRFMKNWKALSVEERENVLADPWAFDDYLNEQEGAWGAQFRHMILHLTFPEYFERISSRSHKNQILNVFQGMASDEGSLDYKIYQIRQKLGEYVGYNDFDFYEEEIESVWRSGGASYEEDLFELIAYKKQIVLYGPPGTGKTFQAKQLAQQIVRAAAIESWSGEKFFKEQDLYQEIEAQHIHRLQLHPAYSYEDFIRSLHISEGGQTEYRRGYLPLLIEQIQEEQEGSDESKKLPHVLILDEMNRTDLSRMLGECFSLLEDREHPVDLPGVNADGQVFKLDIPENLYIIGTMNLIDQSVEQIDFALRRRFLWKECPFDADVLGEMLVDKWENEKNAEKVKAKIAFEDLESDFAAYVRNASALNTEISNSPNLGRQYEIGHTYFVDVIPFLFETLRSRSRMPKENFLWNNKGNPQPALEKLWRVALAPLLEQYLAGIEVAIRQEELDRLKHTFLTQEASS